MLISIIIPTLNAEKYFSALKEALEQQSYQSFEIIIIDSESDDNTVSLFESIDARVIPIKRADFQHGETRNLGANYAAGEILVFMTQDALPDHDDWLQNLIHPICSNESSASFARQIPYDNATPLEQFARQTNYPSESRLVSKDDIQTLGARAFFFSNSCSAIKRSVFEAFGGFTSQTIMNEDMLLASRLLSENHSIAYTANAVVKHSHNYGAWRTFQRYFDIGVVMKQAEADLAAVPLSKEGLSYVKHLFLFLIAGRHYNYLFKAFVESAAKWLGFRLGKHYAFYPQSILKQVSMHGDYWNENRWFFSLTKQLSIPLIQILTDCLTVITSFLIAYGIRAKLLPNFFNFEPFTAATNYFSLWPALAILILLRASFGLYPGYIINEADELKRQTLSSSLVLAFVLAGGTLFRFWELYSRSVLLGTSVILLISLPIVRALSKHYLAKTKLYGIPIWIIGSSERAEDFKKIFKLNPLIGLNLIGQSQTAPKDTYAPYCLVVPDDLKQGELAPLLDTLHKQFKNIILAPSLLNTASAWVTPRDLKGNLTLELKNMLQEPHNQLLKRSFDYIFSSFLIITLSPLILVIAALIKLNSKGDSIFKQERIGRYGKKFDTYKFRTMRSDATEVLEKLLEADPQLKQEWQDTRKLKNDPRISKLGHFLRRSSLDELPQLFNIWKGDMSFVGPRPIVEAELSYYGDKRNLYERATPGLSGLTQVSGRSDLSYDERVKLDSYYSRNWSIWLDIVIIAKTIVTVLKREGAY